ncbi:hypothetical protein Cflav_PD2954 [Pedosphaera parvula Ellin514]|uniref:Uncharacterized protein n=1 Tax=Pedosphaera parvula (strain Ellin514) TaxID=320771 RepID=B9XIJ5_PEDPL|nr:hypothetical protein Cflav_PD2954 [Pedosphaera parvula Ellin514]
MEEMVLRSLSFSVSLILKTLFRLHPIKPGQTLIVILLNTAEPVNWKHKKSKSITRNNLMPVLYFRRYFSNIRGSARPSS